MKLIHIDSKPIDNKDVQSGRFNTIIILTQKDLKDTETLACTLCGKDIDLLYVPRELTEEELSVVLPCIMDGIIYTGKIINYNK